MNRTPSRVSLGRLTLLLAAVAPQVRAQDKPICIPEAYGVPNLNGLPMYGAPIWWGTGATMLKRLDDPRWNGAVSQDFNGEVTFRALHRTGAPVDTLFLSWQTKIDQSLEASDVASNTTGDPTGDQLVVGIKQASNVAIILHLGLATDAGAQEANKDGVAYKAYTWDGTTLADAGSPSWLQNTKAAWTWEDVPNTKARWTFQMVVPISTNSGLGLNIPNPFEMFYAFLVEMPSSFPEYLWPGTVSRIRNPTSGIVSYPDPTDASKPWGKVSWGTSSNCAGDVALDANQIGVGNPPINEIKFTYPPNTNSVQNQLTAKPQNVSGNTIVAGRIQADFFLSNYGSAITDSRFWEKISPTSPTNSAGIPAGGLGLIQPSPLFVVADADRCKYIDDTSICNPPGIYDQCILVQLSEVTQNPPLPPLVFRNQSTYNNMLFREASTLRHRAQISVVGLNPLSDSRTARDVYLYVETVNMPASMSGALSAAVTRTRDTLIVAGRDTSLNSDWGVIRLKRGDSLRIPLRIVLLAPGASPSQRFGVVRRAAASGQLTVPEVDAAVPTYRIHAYHATGDSLGKVPILEPQTSFGYWVEHDGEIIGWRHRIEGERLVRLAPNYYKIEVPNNGRTIITTIIEPVEFPRFALSLHAGISLPSDDFKNTHDRGVGVTADAEYWLNRRVGVAGLFGYHRFDSTAAAGNSNLELFHASAALELRVTTGSPSIVIDAGGGTYSFRPGSTDPGAHVGLGVEFDVSPKLSLGVNGRAHSVSTSGSKTSFYGIQAGGHYRW